MTLSRVSAIPVVIAFFGMVSFFGYSTSAIEDQQDHSIDLSGLDLFWGVVDKIQAGGQIVETDWNRLFSHPGYAQIERAGQRRRVVELCLPWAIANPDSPFENSDIPAGVPNFRKGAYSNSCNHIKAILERRSELDTFIADFNEGNLFAASMDRAKAFVPPLASQPRTPEVHLILFEPQGFSGDHIALDLLYFMDMGEERRQQFLGHEFHHALRSALPDNSDENLPFASVFFRLLRMEQEGVASMVDKAPYIETAELAGSATSEEWVNFNELFRETPNRLGEIDKALVELTVTEPDYDEIAKRIGALTPWGGHINGVYMARHIDAILGREALLDTVGKPVAFFLTYQKAALEGPRKVFVFSEMGLEAISQFCRGLSGDDDVAEVEGGAC